MKYAYILVGVPASGKSTWTEKQHDMNTIVISTDHYIEQMSQGVGKTYSEVFDECIKHATSNMLEDVKYAVEHGFNIIWDQTNTTIKARARKLKMLTGYTKIAVVFKTPDHEELQRRLNSRPGKHIPQAIVNSMIESFVVPTREEGFNEVVYA